MAISESARDSVPARSGARHGPGDARLIRLARAGEARAFETIFARYHQELYRYCRAILGNAHDAEDALQATMAAALGALPGETRRISLRPWLYRVAHNEAISIVRRRQPIVDAEAVPEGAAD